MIPAKYKNLILATAMFNLGFVIWFSFAPFMGEIADEFGLSVSQLGLVSSAAVIATRHGAVVLCAASVMTFGLEVAMNGWLGTYYREGFGQGDIVIAATFSIAVGLLRPIGGYVSDVVARNETNILPWFEGRYREQWTFATMAFVCLSMFGVTAAGLSGNIYLAVGAGFLVGVALTAWVFQPRVAERATEDGWFASNNPATAGGNGVPSDD